METILENNAVSPALAESVDDSTANPAYQAYQILRIAFTVAPIVAGVDKFLGLLVN